jgi:hypothetical protein
MLMEDAEKVILIELQQTAEGLGLPFDVERYRNILGQMSNEYDDECMDLGMMSLFLLIFFLDLAFPVW